MAMAGVFRSMFAGGWKFMKSFLFRWKLYNGGRFQYVLMFSFMCELLGFHTMDESCGILCG